MSGRRDLFASSSNGRSGSGYVSNNVFYQSTAPASSGSGNSAFFPSAGIPVAVPVPVQQQQWNNGFYRPQPAMSANYSDSGVYYNPNNSSNGGHARGYAAPVHQPPQQTIGYAMQPQQPPHWSKTLSAQIDAKPRPPSATESVKRSGLGTKASVTFANENDAGNASSSSGRQRDSSESAGSSTGSESSEIMWEARRARERAEQEAEQKLIDAVCKASLLEFNEKERALQDYEKELVANDSDFHSGSFRLKQERTDAEQRKRDAMQRVIDSKQKAQLMAAKAREATELYEKKNAERIAKQAELEELEQQREREAALLAAQQKKEDAIRKREDAERRANEAREKAEAMRRRAIDAAQIVRAQSRKQIETELTHEEAQRTLGHQRKLQELEMEKTTARDRKEVAARKAADAQRRADELRLRAEQARRNIQQAGGAAA